MARSVGFIGLGIMGLSMAKRLVEAGHTVTVYNRTPAKAAPLLALGAKQAATPRDAALGNEIVISIVTDSPDVEEVLLGRNGAVHAAEKNALFIDMTTIAPETARKAGKALEGKGVAFLDAPVTGGDVGAREGTLSILVGGAAADLERAREVFNVLGKRITHFGPIGAGQTAKACNQILCAMNMTGIVEALHLARLSGLDPALVVEALGAGAGGSWALEKLGSRIAKGDFNPGFYVDLIQKDLRIVQDTARPLGLPLEGTALAQKLFADNQEHAEGRLGTQAMYKALERKVKTKKTTSASSARKPARRRR
ncbi:MAG TPA: NAD(P)-dependent oxidoreductase [Planctomycetota bacterium]|nr:NAD(P)-dependent oxidoreductase [Planctomycetota bacterium]